MPNKTLFTKIVHQPVNHSWPTSLDALENIFSHGCSHVPSVGLPGLNDSKTGKDEGPGAIGTVGRPRGAEGHEKQICQALKLKTATWPLVGVGSRSRFLHLSFKLFNVKNLVICKTKHLLLNSSLTTKKPRIICHFINKNPEPKFLEIPPGQSMPVCFSVTGEINAALSFRGISASCGMAGSQHHPVIQKSNAWGSTVVGGQLCPRESGVP